MREKRLVHSSGLQGAMPLLFTDQVLPTRRWVAPHARAYRPVRAPFYYAARRGYHKASPVCQVGGPEFSAAPESVPESISIPKFRPFNPHTQLREDVFAFQHAVPVGEGEELVMMTLRECWIREAADILTDSFAESMGYRSIYKNFLRHQILQYLQNHLDLPPKTVVLVALLRDAAGSDGAGSVCGTGGKPWSDGGGSSSSSQNGGGGLGSSGGGVLWPAAEQQSEGGAPDAMPWPTSLSPSDPAAGAATVAAAAAEDGGWGGGSPGSSDGLLVDGPETIRGDNGRVVGVVEVSFTPSTRSKFLTLNPPTDRPFLSNMCVAAESRGRGFGKAIMAAAESLVELIGETEIWLHVRVQDEPAARLYEAAGFQEVQRDSILLSLIGMDRRRLMRKRLRQL